MATTRLSDVVVPEIFAPYVQNLTKEKSALISSGAVVVDSQLSGLLAGGGFTFNQPFWKDLANDEENVSSDDPATRSTPNKITTGSEIQVRMSRNNSWSAMDLTGELAGSDPMAAIGSRVGAYWTRRLQRAFVATMQGVFADNADAPSGTEHVQNDLTFDVSGLTGDATKFSAAAFIDATATMGDAADDLSMIMVHSVVYNRMRKNNIIDYIPVSINGQVVRVESFLGKRVIVDDSMPVKAGVFESWIFRQGVVRMGFGSPANSVEVWRDPSAGNGGGQDVLFNRQEWIIHPVGHAFVGNPASKGGPSNADTAGNLANKDSWKRVFPERKQLGIARLLTKE